MPVTVTIESPDGQLAPKLSDMEIRLILKHLGEVTINTMLEKTARGKSVDGGPFKAYSESYIRWKSSHGTKGQKLKGWNKKGTKLSGRIPMGKGDWLTDTGQLLASLQITRNENGELDIECIGDRSDSPLTNDELGEAVNLVREWIGLSLADVEMLGSEAEAWLAERML